MYNVKRLLFALMAIIAVTSAVAQIREVQVYRDGRIIQAFPLSDIDSVKVGYSLAAPAAVNCRQEGDYVMISWSQVDDAVSYEVYRSADNAAYSLLDRNILTTAFADSLPLPGTNYYRIRAVGKVHESGLSACPDSVTYVCEKGADTQAGGADMTGDEHEYVDLGLPSGTLWATCNVGAGKPEEYGDYFAWGETAGYKGGKTIFDRKSYKYYGGSYAVVRKYCTNSNYGTVDDRTVLEASDDAATVNWGSGWQMPSPEQFAELIDSSHTTATWTSLNGVNGMLIVSRSNGNRIFLPAAGCYHDDMCYTDSYGNLWSRSVNTSNLHYGYYLYFNSKHVYVADYSRYSGRSVRPVRVHR